MAKEEAYEELYTKLDTREGSKIIYKLARSRDRRSRDISDISYVKDEDGTILTESGKIKGKWNFFLINSSMQKWSESQPEKNSVHAVQ